MAALTASAVMPRKPATPSWAAAWATATATCAEVCGGRR
jgi:hypothetical protein